MASILSHFSADRSKGNVSQWHLSLWTRPDATAWALHDLKENACVALVSGQGTDLPDAARIPVHTASVSLIVEPELSTLVPDPVIVPGEEARHLEFVHGRLPAGQLRTETVDLLQAQCIFQHDEAAERRMLERFPSARPMALRTVLINAALARGDNGPTMLLHRGHRRCDLVITNDRRVLLSNSFHAPAATDALYFALFALEQTGQRPDTTRVMLAGPSLTPEEKELIERYFTRVAPAIDRTDRSLAGLGIESPEHWLCVLDQWTCAS